MKQSRREKIRSRRRRSKLLILFLLCMSVSLLLTGGILIYKLNKTQTHDSPTPGTPVKNLSIEIPQKDIRTVKNTATEESHKTNGLAICMYHYIYDKNNPPEKLNNNYIEIDALKEELQYLIDNEYYFPTWQEVRQYIDGELLLPEKSIVLTFDDGLYDFLRLGVPIFNEYKIPVTIFMISKNSGEKKVAEFASDYVTFQSHSHNMHRAGGRIGHGGIFTALPREEALADLQKSISICQNSDAFAYPYGDYTDSCVDIVNEAGFLCAVTTEYGRVYPGDNPLILPRMRMSRGQSLETFISMVE